MEKQAEYLTVQEVMRAFKLSQRTVLRLFENEPGVIVITSPENVKKRRYRTIRIPRGVFLRVMTRMGMK
jgi:transcriptional regulator GlxA family with amidase domain